MFCLACTLMLCCAPQVIVEKNAGADIQDLEKNKYLVPSDLVLSQFIAVVRKRVQISEEKSLTLYINKTIASNSSTMAELYEKHRDEDGFIYMTYGGENTFGCA